MDLEVLTVKEIAKILHIQENTIHNKKWQERTGCPLKKVGKRLYSISSEFSEWFRKNTL